MTEWMKKRSGPWEQRGGGQTEFTAARDIARFDPWSGRACEEVLVVQLMSVVIRGDFDFYGVKVEDNISLNMPDVPGTEPADLSDLFMFILIIIGTLVLVGWWDWYGLVIVLWCAVLPASDASHTAAVGRRLFLFNLLVVMNDEEQFLHVCFSKWISHCRKELMFVVLDERWRWMGIIEMECV